jgi:hypothetical protein
MTSNDNDRAGPSTAEGPVGEGNYTVQAGDCVESIAFEHGHFWETLWNHPNNRQLREIRKDPNVLLPGDRIFIPDPRIVIVHKPTGARHQFLRRGVPSVLRLRLLEEGEPRADEPYVLKIDGKSFSGKTDREGRIEQHIPPNARFGEVTLTTTGEEYPLILGGLDPVSNVLGIQERLNNLGFDCGPNDGTLTDRTVAALKRFQSEHGLPVTGDPDTMTQQKLLEVHGG